MGLGRKRRASMSLGWFTMGLKIHVRQDVLFDIDPRGHLNQFQAFLA